MELSEKKFNSSLLGMIVALSLFLLSSGHPLQAGENPPPPVVKMGYSSRLFFDIDIRDAQVAMDMMTREMNQIVTGAKIFPKSIIFQDNASMFEAVKTKQIDFLTLSSVDYLRFKDELNMDPFLISAGQVDGSQKRILLVRKDSGIAQMVQLKGRSLNLVHRMKDEASTLWIETLLARERILNKEAFLKQVKEVGKASQAVLPVFFKQSDSAIVTTSAFETLGALNPQLKGDLSIIATSKNLPGGVFCARRGFDPSIKSLLLEKLPQLNESLGTKQLFVLLQTDKIIPFQASYLDNLIELEREHRNLMPK